MVPREYYASRLPPCLLLFGCITAVCVCIFCFLFLGFLFLADRGHKSPNRVRDSRLPSLFVCPLFCFRVSSGRSRKYLLASAQPGRVAATRVSYCCSVYSACCIRTAYSSWVPRAPIKDAGVWQHGGLNAVDDGSIAVVALPPSVMGALADLTRMVKRAPAYPLAAPSPSSSRGRGARSGETLNKDSLAGILQGFLGLLMIKVKSHISVGNPTDFCQDVGSLVEEHGISTVVFPWEERSTQPTTQLTRVERLMRATTQAQVGCE